MPTEADIPLRPWAKRAVELEAAEGMYAEYAAWQEWMAQQMRTEVEDHFDEIQELNSPVLAVLYSACCEIHELAVKSKFIRELPETSHV